MKSPYRLFEVAFDIETIPAELPESVDAEIFAEVNGPLPEVSAPSSYRKPELIQKYIEEKTLELTASREARREEIRRGLALSPMTGRIVCICLYGTDPAGETVSRCILEEDERALLTAFWDAIRPMKTAGLRLVSFNGKSFDGHFILVRSSLQNLTPRMSLDLKRYQTHNHFDVREVLTNFGSNPRGKLGQWAAVFGLGAKLAEGAAVETLWREKRYPELQDYCMQDAVLTFELYKKVLPFYSS